VRPPLSEQRIGETPNNCSFHLRQLARYGFVEEAGGGKGRARPWRLASLGWDIPVAHALHTAISLATDQEADEGPDDMLEMFPGLAHADQMAYGFFEKLFRTGDEPDASVESGLPEDDEDWLNSDDFTGPGGRMLTEWQRELGLEGIVPSILDSERTATGIGWGDKVALRFTTVHD
jgi:hypothetical protein